MQSHARQIAVIAKRNLIYKKRQPMGHLIQYLRWESNPNLKFRKLPFYPLNYRGNSCQTC